MKKNNRGFMLVEVIITSTVIITALVTFYYEFNKIYVKYNEKNNYHDLDGLYATKEVLNYFLTNDNFDFNGYVSQIFNNSSNKYYSYIIKNGTTSLEMNCSNAACNEIKNKIQSTANKESINSIKNLYNIKNMIITEYEKCDLDSTKCNLTNVDDVKKSISNSTFKDYIDYLISYYNIEDQNTNGATNLYKYIIITEVEITGMNNTETYYSNLRVR